MLKNKTLSLNTRIFFLLWLCPGLLLPMNVMGMKAEETKEKTIPTSAGEPESSKVDETIKKLKIKIADFTRLTEDETNSIPGYRWIVFSDDEKRWIESEKARLKTEKREARDKALKNLYASSEEFTKEKLPDNEIEILVQDLAYKYDTIGLDATEKSTLQKLNAFFKLSDNKERLEAICKKETKEISKKEYSFLKKYIAVQKMSGSSSGAYSETLGKIEQSHNKAEEICKQLNRQRDYDVPDDHKEMVADFLIQKKERWLGSSLTAHEKRFLVKYIIKKRDAETLTKKEEDLVTFLAQPEDAQRKGIFSRLSTIVKSLSNSQLTGIVLTPLIGLLMIKLQQMGQQTPAQVLARENQDLVRKIKINPQGVEKHTVLIKQLCASASDENNNNKNLFDFTKISNNDNKIFIIGQIITRPKLASQLYETINSSDENLSTQSIVNLIKQNRDIFKAKAMMQTSNHSHSIFGMIDPNLQAFLEKEIQTKIELKQYIVRNLDTADNIMVDSPESLIRRLVYDNDERAKDEFFTYYTSAHPTNSITVLYKQYLDIETSIRDLTSIPVEEYIKLKQAQASAQ